jgi:hypothetical protein
MTSRPPRLTEARARRRRHRRLAGSSPAQLDLLRRTASANPLLGLAVKLPDTCGKCGHLVAIIGPGKPPHFASLLCRSCGMDRGSLSRATYTFLNEIINKFGAPTEPIVFRNRSTNPESRVRRAELATRGEPQ